jgi:hypothetical protein
MVRVATDMSRFRRKGGGVEGWMRLGFSRDDVEMAAEAKEGREIFTARLRNRETACPWASRNLRVGAFKAAQPWG